MGVFLCVGVFVHLERYNTDLLHIPKQIICISIYIYDYISRNIYIYTCHSVCSQIGSHGITGVLSVDEHVSFELVKNKLKCITHCIYADDLGVPLFSETPIHL